MQKLLEVKNLSLEIENRQLFANLTFDLQAGDLLCISGKSGKGKTSLLRLICQESAPKNSVHSGQIALHKAFCYCPQELALSNQLSAVTNVCASRLPYKSWWKGILGFSQKEEQEALSLLKEFDIEKQSNKAIRLLSGGEQQRVAIARTLNSPAPILILDEPVSQLDWDRSVQVMSKLKNLTQTGGKAAIVVLHDERLIEQFASKVLRMNESNWTLQ